MIGVNNVSVFVEDELEKHEAEFTAHAVVHVAALSLVSASSKLETLPMI